MNMDFFFNRKTIRKYKSEAIPSDTIERMLDAAAQSPTTGGMQLYSVVITTDTDIKEELAKSHFNQPAATGAPMLLTFCADFNRFINGVSKAMLSQDSAISNHLSLRFSTPPFLPSNSAP